MPIAAERKKQIVQDFRVNPNDSGSSDVQIALLTQRINELTEHLNEHPKDNHSRRGLIMMVGKRNRLLRYLARTDRERYLSVIGRLGLRK
jgi:small subunit ribosomal protein S15